MQYANRWPILGGNCEKRRLKWACNNTVGDVPDTTAIKLPWATPCVRPGPRRWPCGQAFCGHFAFNRLFTVSVFYGRALDDDRGSIFVKVPSEFTIILRISLYQGPPLHQSLPCLSVSWSYQPLTNRISNEINSPLSGNNLNYELPKKIHSFTRPFIGFLICMSFFFFLLLLISIHFFVCVCFFYTWFIIHYAFFQIY